MPFCVVLCHIFGAARFPSVRSVRQFPVRVKAIVLQVWRSDANGLRVPLAISGCHSVWWRVLEWPCLALWRAVTRQTLRHSLALWLCARGADSEARHVGSVGKEGAF